MKSMLVGIALSAIGLCSLPAVAQNACSGACGPASDCTGDCIVFPPGTQHGQLNGSCGGNGAPNVGPTCKMDDPELWRGGGSVACGNSLGKVGWAVVRYHENVEHHPRGMVVLAASSDEFAQYASPYLAVQQDQWPGQVHRENELLLAAPSGPCEALWSQIASREIGGAVTDKPQVIYFHAVTDGSGQITSFDVLYSEARRREAERLLAFGRANLKVWSLRDRSTPVEMFGALMEADGLFGAMVEAGSPRR